MSQIVVQLHFKDGNGKVQSEGTTFLVSQPIAITIYEDNERIGFTPLIPDWDEVWNEEVKEARRLDKDS